MQTKKCFKCLEEKPLAEYYKHNMMGDGYLNKCKLCTKKDVKEREEKLKHVPEWVESEKKRGREKYHRLKYKDKHKPNSCDKKEIMLRYYEKYPEKKICKVYMKKMKPSAIGMEFHHWSYNLIHAQDVIELSIRQHNKAHRFLIYDQERMMYRRIDTNELLDTKEKHLEFIMWCIQTKED